MAAETFKKRQKEVARREKQQKKFERRSERKNEKARGENKVEGSDPQAAELAFKNGPTIL